MSYKYQVYKVHDVVEVQSYCDTLGPQGWQLIGIVPFYGAYIAIFKFEYNKE